MKIATLEIQIKIPPSSKLKIGDNKVLKGLKRGRKK